MTGTHAKQLYDSNLIRERHAARRSESHTLFRESAAALIDRAKSLKHPFRSKMLRGVPTPSLLHFVEEQPITPYDSISLFLSHMDLHWANNPAASLADAYEALGEGGLYLGVCWGNQTLREVKHAIQQAEIALYGGISPRFAPLPTMEQASAALQGARFVHCVTDREEIRVEKPDFRSILHMIRTMGETNALCERRKSFDKRALFDRAAEIYGSHFKTKEGDLYVTVEFLFLHGWREQRL